MFIFPYRDDNPSYRYPYVTIFLITLNAVLFLLTTRPGIFGDIVTRYGFTTVFVIERPYIILTSLFLHANVLHILSNMWFLWLYGDNVEDRFGHLPFIGLYFVSGIAGNLIHAAITFFRPDVPVIGASGAVAGIMGAYLVLFPHARIRCLFLIIIYPIFFKLRAFWLLGGWMLYEFLNAFATPQDNIAHWAHIGGFAVGFGWALVRVKRFEYRGRRWR